MTPTTFFAADADTRPARLAVRGHHVTSVDGPQTLLKSLGALIAPDLIVLDAAALLGSDLGVLAALKEAVLGSRATVLLVSDLNGSLTSYAAPAVGAYVAVFGPCDDKPFTRLADSLCERAHVSAHVSSCAVAAAPRIKAAPRLSPRLGCRPARA